jgi:hypothetical protein
VGLDPRQPGIVVRVRLDGRGDAGARCTLGVVVLIRGGQKDALLGAQIPKCLFKLCKERIRRGSLREGRVRVIDPGRSA